MNSLLLNKINQTTTFEETGKILGITKSQVEDLYYDWNADLNVDGFSTEHFNIWLVEKINNI